MDTKGAKRVMIIMYWVSVPTLPIGQIVERIKFKGGGQHSSGSMTDDS